MKRLKILMAAAECVPFAKEGGLADVVGVLPKYLSKMGHDVRVVMPLYHRVDSGRFGLRQIPGVLVVPMGVMGNQYCAVWEGRLPGSDVPVYFLEHEGYYGRTGIYDEDNVGYFDNDNRFIFLSKGALEICKMIGIVPDVVHAHDWHTAALPVLINTSYRLDPHVGGAATFLTVHNVQHQGTFYEGLMDVLGIGWGHFTSQGIEKDGMVNLLKGGLCQANVLNTVSEGYAREMRTKEYGYGLDGVVQGRTADLYGILNGVDYDDWNPETDPYIPANYSIEDLSGKKVCKRELQRFFGLPERDDVPLFGMVSRLAKQKGIDILAEAIHSILSLDIQVVMLGAGEPWAHFYFGDVMNACPQKFGIHVGYDNPLAHRIEAGSDFFLMPSAFEPCGLNQMYSLRYGALPVVRATGGLDDSVENFDEKDLTGTGFKFWDLTAGALFDTVGWAVHTWYNNKEGMEILIRNAMSQRFTWDDSARKYEELYCRALKKRLGEDGFSRRFGD